VVDGGAIEPRLADHSWNMKVGDTLTVTPEMLVESCEWIDLSTGQPLSSLPDGLQTCHDALVNVLDVTSAPQGALVTTVENEQAGLTVFDGMKFTPSAAGVYEVQYRAAWDKTWLTAKGTIVVTQDEPRKPKVTG